MTNWQNRWALTAFDVFLRPYTRLALAGVRYHWVGGTIPTNYSVIIVSNHPSWWDGFLIRGIHRKLRPDAPLYTLMLRETLDDHPVFRTIGGLAVDRRSPIALRRTLLYLQSARERGPAWLSMFPQGSMHPSWDDQMKVEPGVQAFARVLAPVIILPVGIHLEVLDRSRPFAFVSIGRPIPTTDGHFDLELIAPAIADRVRHIRESILMHRERTARVWKRAEDMNRHVGSPAPDLSSST